MAEEVKKAPKPVDVNSAKYKLGKIAADAYVDAIEAKKRGEKVAWVSSNFPVEIPETMGIATVYPANQAAGLRQAEVLSRAGRGHARRTAVLQQYLLLHDQVVREPGP